MVLGMHSIGIIGLHGVLADSDGVPIDAGARHAPVDPAEPRSLSQLAEGDVAFSLLNVTCRA